MGGGLIITSNNSSSTSSGSKLVSTKSKNKPGQKPNPKDSKGLWNNTGNNSTFETKQYNNLFNYI